MLKFMQKHKNVHNKYASFEKEEQRRGLNLQKLEYSPKVQCGAYEKVIKTMEEGKELGPMCTGKVDCFTGHNTDKTDS